MIKTKTKETKILDSIIIISPKKLQDLYSCVISVFNVEVENDMVLYIYVENYQVLAGCKIIQARVKVGASAVMKRKTFSFIQHWSVDPYLDVVDTK